MLHLSRLRRPQEHPPSEILSIVSIVTSGQTERRRFVVATVAVGLRHCGYLKIFQRRPLSIADGEESRIIDRVNGTVDADYRRRVRLADSRR